MYLPKNEFVFQFKMQGSKTKQWYEGTFAVKCLLTLEEQVQVAILTDRFNQGSTTLAPEYGLVNRSLAEIQMRIIKDKDGKMQCPTWWNENGNGATLFDSNIVFGVFSEALKGEKEWEKNIDDEITKTNDRVAAQPKEEEKPAQA